MEAFFVHALAVEIHFSFVSELFDVALLFAEFELHFVLAKFGAGREISETLQSEELGRSVVAGRGEIVRCVQDDGVNIFRFRSVEFGLRSEEIYGRAVARLSGLAI